MAVLQKLSGILQQKKTRRTGKRTQKKKLKEAMEIWASRNLKVTF